jgi:1-acyl-sn-glycerol-3-phosphate acyltransferase
VLATIFYLVELALLALGSLTYRWAHRWPTICTKALLLSWGIIIKQHNKNLLKNLPQCVIVINHRCDLDALIATGYMPGIFKFIGKKELERYPFIGVLVRRLYISVDRTDSISKKQSLHNMKMHSSMGSNIVVFPEGWSNFSNDYLLAFQKGAFKVAIDGQIPILVCTMIHTHELFPKPKIEVHPGVAHVFWETIIPTEGMTYENNNEKLKQQVADIFLARLKEYYPQGYGFPPDQVNFQDWKNKQLAKK